MEKAYIVAKAPYNTPKVVIKWGDRYTILSKGEDINNKKWSGKHVLISAIFKGEFERLKEPVLFKGSKYDIKP